MKFDVILANPPYFGKAALHQRFFVKACDLLEDGGEMMFIHPTVPYVNNKDVRRKKPEVQMIDLVAQYETHIKIINDKVFDNAHLATDLAVTHLTKKPGAITVQYNGGQAYTDVTVNEINVLGIEPKVFANFKSKLAKLVESRGSVQDVVWCDDDQMKLRLQKIRGNRGSADFHTFISKEPKFWDSTTDFGIPLEHEDQRANVASYLKTYVARFTLAMLKMNYHHETGELALTPLVDFNQSWDDEKLCKEFGITDDEYAVIRSVIPTYYEDVK